MNNAPAWLGWLDGGAADEVTLRANVEAWQRVSLRPRVLQALAGSHLRATLANGTLPTPLFVAPMAFQAVLHPHAETGMAMAAAALGAGFVLSCQSSTPMEEVARVYLGDPGRGALWAQLHWLGDRDTVGGYAARAGAAGYEALVLTVDAPVQGYRDRERASGFALPDGVRAVNLPREATRDAAMVLARAPTWDDLAWLVGHTPLPVWVKGVLHPADARLAVEHGAAGVIVSNHGGRQLDTAVASAMALPDVAEAVAGRIPLLVDGGVRRGTDVLKALGLGAQGVMVGRPMAHALASRGAQGVAAALRQLLDEFAIALALCGLRHPDEARQAACRGELFFPFPENAKHSRLE